jgi:purine-binding chemotaxis protein CheW
MPEDAYTQATRIIINRHQNQFVGLIVDQVNKISTFEEIQPVTDQVGSVSATFFKGVAIREGGCLGILNIDHIILQV